MKVTKINEKVELRNNADVELQGCSNDCTEYKNKGYGDYLHLKGLGINVESSFTTADVRQALSIYGSFCYRFISPKTCIYW